MVERGGRDWRPCGSAFKLGKLGLGERRQMGVAVTSEILPRASVLSTDPNRT